ncbi:MAG TPA: TA system VapC family ribonuclease toxin [Vicinamibacterales bacterium]|nr:TA system VapC family ribonuclease toxin [Vicinamibacterales bacterium]
MILVDANLLVYAANTAAAEHERAKRWLDGMLNGPARVGLPWPSLLAFVRLTTNPLVMSKPISPAAAWRQVEEWMGCECAWTPLPGDDHARVLRAFLELDWMTSRLVPDAHLSALAIEHGLTCCSTDADFARFPGLKWENPMSASS